MLSVPLSGDAASSAGLSWISSAGAVFCRICAACPGLENSGIAEASGMLAMTVWPASAMAYGYIGAVPISGPPDSSITAADAAAAAVRTMILTVFLPDPGPAGRA